MKRGEHKIFAQEDRLREGETDKEMNRDGQTKIPRERKIQIEKERERESWSDRDREID